VRTSAFFGPWDKYNFVHNVLCQLKTRKEYSVPADIIVSPTYVPDLVHAALDLFIDGEEGLWHVTNQGSVSWSDFAREVARMGGHAPDRIVERSLEEMKWRATRPLFSGMKSRKGVDIPPLDHALERYFKETITL
jgi:dTDP-4-dehydrorhamnose reductase